MKNLILLIVFAVVFGVSAAPIDTAQNLLTRIGELAR